MKHLAQVLLEQVGVGVNIVNIHGGTALQWAC